MYSTMTATPQRPLPGAFLQTPAPGRSSSTPQLNRPPAFRLGSSQALQRPGQMQSGQSGSAMLQQQSGGQAPAAPALTPIERAAKIINSNLDHDLRYPPIDEYVPQGVSSSYEIAPSATWQPFQKSKTYAIPDRVLEQIDQADLTTKMGLFAELHHAWITIDNALYLWDYTHPNPELLGFEESAHNINAVELVVPRAGVFVKSITHLLVVVTASDVYLIGVASQKASSGVISISLYQTGMRTSIRGMSLSCITGSGRTGRIFAGSFTSDDVYEITYQQEERWFSNKCAIVKQTNTGVSSMLPAITMFGSGPKNAEYIDQVVVDDSRDLLYTLSSKSTIRVYSTRTADAISSMFTKDLRWVMQQLGFLVTRSELIHPNMKIINLDVISAQESRKLYLMATTDSGLRLFLSAGGGWYGQANSLPSEMQIQHAKFPPPSDASTPGSGAQSAPTGPQASAFQGGPPVDTNSKSLTPSDLSHRFPPGFFCCFVRGTQTGNHSLFLATPDAGRIARSQNGQPNRFIESGAWINLNSVAAAVGMITPRFAASNSPSGFGNELAVQFDLPASEIAVLTNSGVQTFRRRRLVDTFAAAMRNSSAEEGFEEVVRKFVATYGRAETCACALAVACGQGTEISADARSINVTEAEVVELARKAFIEQGGKPEMDENGLFDSPIENVRPSPRAQGLASYVSRLVRPVWAKNILVQTSTPTGGLAVAPTVGSGTLRSIQQALANLQDFLEANKNYIEGLSGPDALARMASRNEEVALQGEHRMLDGLLRTVANIVEGIAFIIRFFDDPVNDIMLSLSDTVRQSVRDLTYEKLFCSGDGRSLAKELVKAMVNNSIARGSNVDTVAEALRRQCGSFCSADDVVIFKAQEQLKKASEAGSETETGRSLLNESLKLFTKVAGGLTMENLQIAVEQYTKMSFFAGAIRLTLTIAHERDRVNRALSWIKDGSPDLDSRKGAYDSRQQCYKLIEQVITAVDQQQNPQMNEMQQANFARRKEEAYEEINQSQDEVFQTYLYDWYLSRNLSDRLLQISSPYVISYLQRKSKEDVTHADLLWKYYTHYGNFFEAAKIQLELAKGTFQLPLAARIGYLSRAKANATARVNGVVDLGRSRGSSRQEVLREISDLLDIAAVQEDLLHRLSTDRRLTEQRKPAVKQELDGPILTLDDLYNGYADQASYYDICLVIYQIADFRSAPDIEATWTNLIDQVHQDAVESRDLQPWEAVANKVRDLGKRLHGSEITFPISVILPLLLDYASTNTPPAAHPQHPNAPFGADSSKTWPLDLLLDLSIPYEALLQPLEKIYYRSVSSTTYQGSKHALACRSVLYVIRMWMSDSRKGGGVMFGSVDNALAVMGLLQEVVGDARRGLSAAEVEEGRQMLELCGRVVR